MSQSSSLSFVPRPRDWGQLKDVTPADTSKSVVLRGEDGRQIEVSGDNVKRCEVTYTPQGTPPLTAQGNLLSLTFPDAFARRIEGRQQDIREGIACDVGQAARIFKQKLQQEDGVAAEQTSKTADLAKSMYDSYSRRGIFYRSKERNRFFWLDSHTRYLHELETETKEGGFRHLLFQSHGLVPRETRTSNVISGLRSIASRKAKPAEVCEVAAIHNNAFYVYTNDGYMLRVGAGQRKARRSANGTGGVLFLHHEGLPVLKPARGIHAGRIERLFRTLVRVEDQPELSAEGQLLLLKYWLIAALLTPPRTTRPMVAFLGDAGSGKTKGAAATLLTLFYGEERGLVGLATGQRDVETTLVNEPLACIDNLDGPVPSWLLNLLAGAASGQEVSRRKLFTDEALYSRIPDCNIILTSRDPHFQREDIAQRTLPFYLRKFTDGEDRIPDRDIAETVGTARGECWAEILSLVGPALKIKKERGPFKTNLRLADFAGWIWALACAEDREADVQRLVRGLRALQMRFATTGDPLITAISKAVPNGGPPLERYRCTELLDELTAVDPNLESWSVERLAKQLSACIPVLSWVGIEVAREYNKHDKAHLYTIRRTDPA